MLLYAPGCLSSPSFTEADVVSEHLQLNEKPTKQEAKKKTPYSFPANTCQTFYTFVVLYKAVHRTVYSVCNVEEEVPSCS